MSSGDQSGGILGTIVDKSGTVGVLGAGGVVTSAVLETAVSVVRLLPTERGILASNSSISSNASDSLYCQ